MTCTRICSTASLRRGTAGRPTHDTAAARSGGVAAGARLGGVGWDAGLRKPIPFSEAERSRLEAGITS